MNWLRWPDEVRPPRRWRRTHFWTRGREYVGLLCDEGWGLIFPATDSVKATVVTGSLVGGCLALLLICLAAVGEAALFLMVAYRFVRWAGQVIG